MGSMGPSVGAQGGGQKSPFFPSVKLWIWTAHTCFQILSSTVSRVDLEVLSLSRVAGMASRPS